MVGGALTEYVPMPSTEIALHFAPRPRTASEWVLGRVRNRIAAELQAAVAVHRDHLIYLVQVARLAGLPPAVVTRLNGDMIKVLALPDRFAYLAIILDAWSRLIVGYAIGRFIDARLTLAALQARRKQEMATNRSQPDTGDLFVSVDRAAAIRQVASHYVDLFGDAPALSTLREQYAMPENAMPVIARRAMRRGHG